MVVEAPEPRKLSAIMFTDMEAPAGQRWRDECLQQALHDEHGQLVRDLLPRHGGREVKRMEEGGFLLEFEAGLSAVSFALEWRAAVDARNRCVPGERRMAIRAGAHLGMVVHRDGDVFGEGVNLAARIESLARPGTVYVSETVAAQVEGRLKAPPVRLGRNELKNIKLPVAVFRIDAPVEPRGESALMSRVRSLLGRRRVTAGG
ncbi:adenylate/guanylate cyclase domain-containing protein [Corallococcus praedator]|uniref:Adenylate/guanylate cyclase domain-containing protein n=1 Tax=Corallococcus praedator TaxID=2316724 RepID=A0ABX9QHS8_9BACT|nr:MULTISPECIES: adenylate/guanylate cyclase domain-containing protein [Corallococcus]RKH21080.1 adenylate/guanylate cyclase domain-containing protein [Corallococcus sp. CA047B]RKH32947.1 adenylate/guanylate cyclase domain-containing protein [Corallococcus sp. CA031C]RKI07682.1 adenylate/guanylate cyclase domain-containing protein [Corallococcus praedator]